MMFYVGLDLGQAQDPAAIAVLQREPRSLLVRYLERVALGTPYPIVVDRVKRIVTDQELRGRCALAADGTGVGAPVIDMLRVAGLGCEISAVTITGGEREHRAGQVRYVPKQDLIANVEMLLERGELKIARRLREAGPLVRELMDMRMTWAGRSGRPRLGADGFGEHDDLAIALALACWRAKRPQNGFKAGILLGI